jgi:uncharacterized membrane protein YdfJ with MMPL/SSD domain
MSTFTRRLARRRVPRPVAVLVAVAIGLAGAGAAAGMVLGAVGTAAAGPEIGGGHHHMDHLDDRGVGPGSRPER